MKKALALLLTLSLIFGAICASGAVTASAIEEDVYGVQIVNTGFYPDPEEVPMTYNEDSGLYELAAENVEPQNMYIYVWKNHTEKYGDPDAGNGYPYEINVMETCDVLITFDPETGIINAVGDGVMPPPDLYIYSVIVAGNGEGNYLNGADWDPADTSNSMTEVEDGIWELTLEDVDAYANYNFKFVVDSVFEDGNPTPEPWRYSFGSPVEQSYQTGKEYDAVYGGKNCIFGVTEDGSTVTFRLDIRDFDFSTKKGAKFSVTVTPPEGDVYSVVGSSTAIFGKAWDKDDTSTEMTLDPEDGLYKLTLENVQPEENIDIKVIKNHDWGEAWGYFYKENPRFSVIAPCDVTVTYDAAEDEINVYGDYLTFPWDIKAEYVIAVGSGSGTFLNGANWDPEDESNLMTEVSDDVYEISYSGVAKGSYQYKFTANSVESANPWALNWGSEIEQNYPVNTEIDGVFNGKNCGFEVAEDNSTVTLRLDLSNYDYKTKQGAKMMCSVTPPEGNRYEDIFVEWSVNKFGEECLEEGYDYDELYTHFDGDEPDWVLVRAEYFLLEPEPVLWLRIGGVGGRTIFAGSIQSPFPFGYGVYDVEENKFYGLECFADNPDQLLFVTPECSLDYSEYDGLLEALADNDIGYLTGDVNRDGTVDILDATAIQKYAVGKIKLYEYENDWEVADVNSDGVVDVLDALTIQKYAVQA